MSLVHELRDRAGPAVGAVRHVFDRLPGWALVTLSITVLAVAGEIAFLVVQSGGDGETSSAEETLA